MTKENLSSLEGTIPGPTPEPDPGTPFPSAAFVDALRKEEPDNFVRVPLSEVLNALRAQRTSAVNKRKVAQKKKLARIAGSLAEEIHDVDARIALLEAGPKNQAFQIPLREAHSWGFGLMANGRWPKL
jgi:hypothetical protein